MKTLNIILLMLVLKGCASNNVEINELKDATANNSALELEGHHQFRLDYLIGANQYSYLTFEIKDKHRYVHLLIENNQILAASQISKSELYSPSIRECTLFPYHEDLNVAECLSLFNIRVMKSDDPNFFDELSRLNEDEKKSQNLELTGTLVFSTLLSPLLIPAVIASTPAIIYDYSSSENKRKEFTLGLGNNVNLGEYLQSVDQKYISRFNRSGTAYIASGILNEPAIAFGFSGEDVIWIQKNPSWVCGGGFMFWGLKCTVGKHYDKHW